MQRCKSWVQVYLLKPKNNDVSEAEVVYVNKQTNMAQGVDGLILCIFVTTFSICVSHVLGKCKFSSCVRLSLKLFF